MKSFDVDRREAILAAAERLFAHYGPSKTTIGDIAREAGIGVGSVYLEFCSKDDIVAELAESRHQSVLGSMRAAAREEGSFAERLSRVLEARIVALLQLAEQGTHSCDLVLCSAAPVKSAWGRFQQEELALVASLLEQGTRSGEFAVHDVQPTAELLQRAYATFSPPWLFEQERSQVLRLVRSLNVLLLNGLTVRRRQSVPSSRRRPFGSR
jgi:AcrR family transcriptional regulator